MENKFKRFLSLLLALVMVIGMLPAGIVRAEAAEAKTVYFQNNWLWTDVCVYAWDGSGNCIGTAWPGAGMTLVGNDGTYDIYSATIPADAAGILFSGIKNDNSGNRDQSPDITSGWESCQVYYMNWNDGNEVKVQENKRHTPGTAATCGAAQTCTVCGTVLNAAAGIHTFTNEAGEALAACSVCNEPNPNYVAPTPSENEGEDEGDGETPTPSEDGDEEEDTTAYAAKIGDTGYETVEAAFTAAVNGDEVKIYTAGTYSVPTGKNITITAEVGGVQFGTIGAVNMGVANVTFNNVIFLYAPGSTYKGLQHAGNLVYNNCTFMGQVFLYGTSETFNKCTFVQTDANNYNVWTYGAKKVEFKECTFNCAGKSVLIYSEQTDLVNDVTVTDCDFIASASVEGKAAIEMDSSLTAGINLTIDAATTATGFDEGSVSGNTLWNNKQGNEGANNDITVVVNNETVLKPVVPASGTNSPAYTKEVDGYVRVWGEGGGNASESFVLKLYSGETLIATTQLNNIDDIIDGDVYVTWNFYYPTSNDTYWTTTWEVGHPNSAAQPTKVELWIDGTCVATTDAKMSGADDLNPVVWAELGGVKKIVTGLSGEGTAENPYLINNLDELLWFQAKVDELASDGSTQFAGKYFKLTADIDLAGIEWNPIGSMSGDHGSFKGVFDGDGHTISNLTISNFSEKGAGLFAYTSDNAEIKNLTLNNVSITSTGDNVGAVVGNAFADTKITNVHVTGNINISGHGYIGGIAGHGYVVMDNVSVKGNEGSTISSSFWCAGGILGYGGEGTTNITNASVENLTIKSAAGGLGSIVGMAEDNEGTQPISGSNLSAKDIEIETYSGAYGTGYAEYALGYLYGGNPTSKLTGTLSAENVTFSCSNGNTAPEVADAVATIGNSAYFDLKSAAAAIATDGTDTTIKILTDIEVPETITFAYGTGKVTFTADKPVTIKQTATSDFTFTQNPGVNNKIIVGENVTFETYDNSSDVSIWYGPSLELNGTITGGANWGALYLFQGEHTVSETGKIGMGRVQIRYTDLTVNGEVDTNYLLVEKSTFTADGATVDANVIFDNNNGGQRDGASTFNIKNSSNVTAGTVTLSYADSVLTIDMSSTLTATTITGAGKIVIDAADYESGDTSPIIGNASTFNGTIEVINNDALEASIDENGNIVLTEVNYVASVTDAEGKVTKYDTLAAAINAAEDGDTVTMLANFDYGTTALAIDKKITLDLGGKTLTTHGRNYGLALYNDCSVTNGKLVHAGTVAAIKVWDAVEISNLEIDVTGTSASGNTIDGIVIQENAACVDTIKNVTIHSTSGQGVDSGIKTYNCGNATDPVIGSMENVEIDAKSVGLNIYAPVGTVSNSTIKGGTSGIELWIKGTYSATLDLVNCKVSGGQQAVYAHDEFSSNPDIVNNGTLKLTADANTTFANDNGAILTLTIARAENVDLSQVIAKTVAQVDNGDTTATYYDTLQNALNACTNGETVKLIANIVYTVDDVVYAHGGATGFGKYDQYNPSIIYFGAESTNTTSSVNAVLDLNGYTITNNADAYLFLLMDDAKVTFTDSVGTGSITTTTKYPVIWVTGTNSLATINSGKYITANDEGLLWATHAGDLVINGGTFETTAEDASLLIMRNNKVFDNSPYNLVGTATITITGGTFDYNPEVTYDDNTNPFAEFNACADGYIAVDNNGTWTVQEAIELASVTMGSGTNQFYSSELYTVEDVQGCINDMVYYGNIYQGINGYTHIDITILEDITADLNIPEFKYGNVTIYNYSKLTGEVTVPDDYVLNVDTEADTATVKKAPPVAQIGETTYTSIQKAVNAANAGDTIEVIAEVTGETVTVNKSVTITGTKTLTDVSITADGTDVELTVSGLTFAGNSWINANNAKKLTVSGVTANVTPNNGTATNSRSAFIALGASEQNKLELVVENSNLVANGGTDPILGWAQITKATITGNTFGSADAYQTSSDSAKFMSIADGAEFTITGNTVYSNYNGFVFYQNTTRDNAYTVIVEDNDFYGSGDMIWVEMGNGVTTTHATIKATSDNTVNGAPLTALDLKASSKITAWTNYAGVDVESDEDGKLIGGTFTEKSNKELVAEGYVAVDNEDGTWTVYDYVEWIKAELLAGHDVTLEQDITVTYDYVTTEPCTANGNGQYNNWGVFTVINGDVTFDLNGHNITFEDHSDDFCNKVAFALFYANNGAKMTVVGDGNVTVKGMATAAYSTCVGSELTIKGGNWVNNPCTTCSATNIFLYASHGGALYIEGGKFEQALDANGDSYLIVEHTGYVSNNDALVDYSKTVIEITGGTFVGMNPEKAHSCNQVTWNKQEWSTTNVVADGYVAVDNGDNSWTVKTYVEAGYVAQNTETNELYETVSEALEDAENGETVILLTDATEGYVIIPAGVTLNLQSYTLTASYVIGVNGSYLTANINSGKLIVDRDKIVLSEKAPTDSGYAVLPIWNEDHYVFSKIGIYDSGESQGLFIDEANDEIYFQFKHQATTAINQSLFINGVSDNEVKIAVRVEWTSATGTASLDFVYKDEHIANVVGTSNDYALTLGGCVEELEIDMSTLKVYGCVISDSGVIATGTVWTQDTAKIK